MNAYLLIFIMLNPSGDGDTFYPHAMGYHSYVADSGLTWWECKVAGTLAESYYLDLVWHCEVAEGDVQGFSTVRSGRIL